MASTAKLLHLRPKARPIPNPSSTRFFSSASSSNDDEPKSNPNATGDDTSSQSKSSFSSYFSDVKASLKQQPPQHRPSPAYKPFSLSSSGPPTPPSRVASFEEIRKNLSEFRRRAAPPGPPSQPISFQELYNRNVIQKGDQVPAGAFPFERIRESIKQLKSTSVKNQPNGVNKIHDSLSLNRLKDSLKLRPEDPIARERPTVIGGTGNLPISVFGKELGDKKEDHGEQDAMRSEFLKNYSYKELGEMLRRLRPEKKKDENNWFSLEELNVRLIKLREYEEKVRESGNVLATTFRDLRDSLVKLQKSEDDEKKKNTMQRLSVLGQLGETPSFMLSPPKEHLVEKYFHPDNMSSAEKLKLELKKVRDEFKMSESDCGSARVQVAQLTTKIKHLSSALHKKDKHSRKGLLAMVQRRKKLLKYLRRTDWDSYCLVLSKLGLRDNPDYKN